MSLLNSSSSRITTIVDKHALGRNIRAYGWVRMGTMRVYYPLLAVYLNEVGHVSLVQLGMLVAISKVTMLIVNVPTGYLADRWTRKMAIVIGALFLTGGAAIYLPFPEFPGAVAATIIESIGFAILSGAGEALLHDTLHALGREDDYVKVAGRAQSFGLVGNVLLVGVASLTYGQYKQLPFVFGVLLALYFTIVALSLVEPPRPAHGALLVGQKSRHDLASQLRVFVNRYTIVFFVGLGLLSAAYSAQSPFTNLALTGLGLKPEYLGLLYSAGSVLAAIVGRYIYYLKRLSLQQYALIDVSLAVFTFGMVGVTKNVYLAAFLTVVSLAFWRNRPLLYQDYFFRRFGGHRYKATLISTIGFFDTINAWIPLLLGLVVARLGLYPGIRLSAVVSFVLIMGVFLFGIRRLEASHKSKSAGLGRIF